MSIIDLLFAPTEERILRKGEEMLAETFEKQKDLGEELQRKYEFLTNKDILTTELPFNRDIPEKYRERVTGYREYVRKTLFGIARELQDVRYSQLDKEITAAGLHARQEQRYLKMRDAQKDIYASYDIIRQSFDYIKTFNDALLKKINATDGKKKTELLLLNAIVVYELTDAIIEMIEEFQIKGKDTLRSIHTQIHEELDSQEKEDSELLQKAKKASDDVARAVTERIDDRKKIRGVVREHWEKIWDHVFELETKISQTQGQLPTLHVIRDDAKAQISILAVIGITQIVESSLKSFQDICGFREIQLAPLTKDDVFNLLGAPNVNGSSPQ